MRFSLPLMLAWVLTGLLEPGIVRPGLRAEEIDLYMAAELRSQNCPGAAIAITRGEEVLFSKGYGLANLEWNQAAEAGTLFALASVTKQFTAVAIALLARDGKLSLDDPVSRHLKLPAANGDNGTNGASVPNITNIANITHWAGITIRHLLSHTAGLPSYTGLANYPQLSASPLTHAGLIDLIKPLPLEFPPGERFAYCNSGYYLLGLVIEEASGLDYARFLQQRLFQPAGMEHSRLYSASGVVRKRAEGYRLRGEALERADYLHYSWPFAAGALYSSADEMARWQIALLHGRILPEPLLEQLWTPFRLRNGAESTYGAGWSIRTQRGRKIVEHAGGINGFSSFTKVVPALKLSVTVLCNSENAQPARIASHLLERFEPSLSTRPIDDSNSKLTETLRDLLQGWSRADLSQARLTPEMREHLAKELSHSSSWLKSLGQPDAIELREESTREGWTERIYKVKFRESAWTAATSFDPEGRIAKVQLSPE